MAADFARRWTYRLTNNSRATIPNGTVVMLIPTTSGADFSNMAIKGTAQTRTSLRAENFVDDCLVAFQSAVKKRCKGSGHSLLQR